MIMKMKNCGDGFGDDELVVADIDRYLSSSTTCRDVLSLTTPLSFFPTELDRKCKCIKILFKKV